MKARVRVMGLVIGLGLGAVIAGTRPASEAADEMLATGKVMAVTTRAHGAGRCPERAGMQAGPDGRMQAVVSNACGCEELWIQLDRVYVGRATRQDVQLEHALGEWCRPTVTVTSRVLVHMLDGRVTWTELEPTEDDGWVFRPSALGPVQGKTIAPDVRGYAPLRALIGNATLPE